MKKLMCIIFSLYLCINVEAKSVSSELLDINKSVEHETLVDMNIFKNNEEKIDYSLTKRNFYDDKNKWYSSKESLADFKNRKERKVENLYSYLSENFSLDDKNAKIVVDSVFFESEKKGLQPELVLSIIEVESKFNPSAKSRGAVGLGQVMEKVHKKRIEELKKENLTILSIPGNIKIFTDILKEYIDLANGNIVNGLQMYNGSAKDIKKKYSTLILEKMKKFQEINNKEKNLNK